MSLLQFHICRSILFLVTLACSIQGGNLSYPNIPFVLTVLLLLFEAGLLLKHKLLSMPLQFSLKSCLLHLKFLLIQFQHQHFTPNSNKSLCLVCTILAPNITKLGKRDKEKIQEVTNFG